MCHRLSFLCAPICELQRCMHAGSPAVQAEGVLSKPLGVQRGAVGLSHLTVITRILEPRGSAAETCKNIVDCVLWDELYFLLKLVSQPASSLFHLRHLVVVSQLIARVNSLPLSGGESALRATQGLSSTAQPGPGSQQRWWHPWLWPQPACAWRCRPKPPAAAEWLLPARLSARPAATRSAPGEPRISLECAHGVAAAAGPAACAPALSQTAAPPLTQLLKRPPACPAQTRLGTLCELIPWPGAVLCTVTRVSGDAACGAPRRPARHVSAPPPPACAPPRSAAAADAQVLSEVPKDGSAARDIMVPEWAGMSYDAQYDDLFSKPLNLRKVGARPLPPPACCRNCRRRGRSSPMQQRRKTGVARPTQSLGGRPPAPGLRLVC